MMNFHTSTMYQVYKRSIIQYHSFHLYYTIGSKTICCPNKNLVTFLSSSSSSLQQTCPYMLPRQVRRRRHVLEETIISYSTMIKSHKVSLLFSNFYLVPLLNHEQRTYSRYFTTETPQSTITAVPSTALDESTVVKSEIEEDLDSTTEISRNNNNNDDDNNNNTIPNERETFHKLLYNDAAYFEAYKYLSSTTTTSFPVVISNMKDEIFNQSQRRSKDDWKHNAYIQLFDAVIVHHGKLLDTYNRGFPTMLMQSSMYNNNNTNSSTTNSTVTNNTTTTKAKSTSMTSTITAEQIDTLRQMIQMAEIASNCIEIIEPYLGARNPLLIDRTIVFQSSDDDDVDGNDDTHIQEENDDDPSYDDNEPAESNDINDGSITSSRDGPNDHMIQRKPTTKKSSLSTSPIATTNRKQTRKKRKEIDLDLTTRCNDVLTAWAQTVYAGYRGNATRSYLRAIPQRAQFLLSRMELTVEDEMYDGLIVPPSLLSYNNVLQTWAYSNEHLRAAYAQLIFDKLMSKKLGTAYGNIRPDGESYRLIIWAWALSRERRAAFIATGHLIKMLRRLEVGFDDDVLYEGVAIEPSLDDYNVVAQAWIRSEEKNSPSKAQSVLKLMERVYKKGVTMLQPDFLCYKCVFLAAAKRHDVPELGPLIDETLTMMKDRFIVPDTECYTAAIKTWKNAAIHQPDVTVANQQNSVRRAIELLAEMDVAHNQSTMVSISVSTENINDVLEALTVSTHPSRTSMVDELLNKLSRDNTEGTSTVMKATADSYIYALRVWRTVESMEKVAKGKAILWRVKDNYAELVRRHNSKKENRNKDQIVDIFNEFVQLCGSYQPQSDKDGLQVLGEALDAIRVMRSMDVAGSGLYHKLIPTAATFASLFTAVSNLLSPGSPERRIAAETIFNMCCDDGMVDDVVLQCFRDAATSDQFATMVESNSEIVEGMKVVPESWTANALGGKVKSADGRKTVPLGVDGILKRTMAMKEFQMRRLLDHRNRELLRGGRWRQKKQSNYRPQPHTDGTEMNSSYNYHTRKPWKLYDGNATATN